MMKPLLSIKKDEHKSLVEKWKDFFNVLGIDVITSDNTKYDLMSKRTTYYRKRHFYIKIHDKCIWESEIKKVKKIDENVFHELHLSDTINKYPNNYARVHSGVMLGIFFEKGIPSGEKWIRKIAMLQKCKTCDKFNIDEWLCSCNNGIKNNYIGLYPSDYKRIVSVAENVNIPISNKNLLDISYMPYTPSISLPDEEGKYIYVILKKEKGFNAVKIGTVSSSGSFLWNISGIPDIEVKLLLFKENAVDKFKAITDKICAQNGWVINVSTDTLIRKIINE